MSRPSSREGGPLLYHGTRAPFRGPGGLVLPRSVHGGPGTTAPLNPGRALPADAAGFVYVTEDLDVAWVYAWHAPGRGAPRVLVVAACGLEADPEHSEGMGAWRCRSARVLRVLRKPTVDEESARAGWLVETPPEVAR